MEWAITLKTLFPLTANRSQTSKARSSPISSPRTLYTRSWFQTPNAYDNLNVQNVIGGGTSPDPVFGNVGNTDQRSKIQTFNIAPTYSRSIGNNSVFNFGPYFRKDFYNYYPSNNPLA